LKVLATRVGNNPRYDAPITLTQAGIEKNLADRARKTAATSPPVRSQHPAVTKPPPIRRAAERPTSWQAATEK
jgi:hypothetical protein